MSVKHDICKAFDGKSIEEIRINRDLILQEDSSNIIKLRLKNSSQNLGSSNGFRLIYIVSKSEEKVIFLEIYPKRGTYGKNNITDKDLVNLLKELKLEIDKNILIEHNILLGIEEIDIESIEEAIEELSAEILTPKIVGVDNQNQDLNNI